MLTLDRKWLETTEDKLKIYSEAIFHWYTSISNSSFSCKVSYLRMHQIFSSLSQKESISLHYHILGQPSSNLTHSLTAHKSLQQQLQQGQEFWYLSFIPMQCGSQKHREKYFGCQLKRKS